MKSLKLLFMAMELVCVLFNPSQPIILYGPERAPLQYVTTRSKYKLLLQNT